MSFLIQAIYPLYPRPYSFLDPLPSCLLFMTFLTWIYFEVIYQCCLVSTFLSFLSLNLRVVWQNPALDHSSTVRLLLLLYIKQDLIFRNDANLYLPAHFNPRVASSSQVAK
jgi:hypothetical protein